MTVNNTDITNLTQKRVLVVEDSALVAMDLCSVLAEAGYATVGPAATVEDAIKLIDSSSIDVVLLDMNLNGVMSIPVAEKLRGLGVPFAFLTGYEKKSPFAENFPGCPVVQKPIEENLMLGILKNLIESKRHESVTGTSA